MGKASIHKRVRRFERIDLYGPMERSKYYMSKYYGLGYRIVRSGPKIKSFPKVDMSRFHFIMEREIDDPANQTTSS